MKNSIWERYRCLVYNKMILYYRKNNKQIIIKFFQEVLNNAGLGNLNNLVLVIPNKRNLISKNVCAHIISTRNNKFIEKPRNIFVNK